MQKKQTGPPAADAFEDFSSSSGKWPTSSRQPCPYTGHQIVESALGQWARTFPPQTIPSFIKTRSSSSSTAAWRCSSSFPHCLFAWTQPSLQFTQRQVLSLLPLLLVIHACVRACVRACPNLPCLLDGILALEGALQFSGVKGKDVFADETQAMAHLKESYQVNSVM